MAKSGNRKSFSGSGLKTSPKPNQTNPTGSVYKGGAGFTGRATNPRETPAKGKGNP